MLHTKINGQDTYVDGNHLLYMIVGVPSFLTAHLNEEMKWRVMEFRRHVDQCTKCKELEFPSDSYDDVYDRIGVLFGEEVAWDVLEDDCSQPMSLLPASVTWFGHEYERGFRHRVNLECPWQLLVTEHCTKGYCQGLMDADTLCKMLETEYEVDPGAQGL